MEKRWKEAELFPATIESPGPSIKRSQLAVILSIVQTFIPAGLEMSLFCRVMNLQFDVRRQVSE